MELYIALAWLILAVYFAWRLHVLIKTKEVVNQEIACVVFMPAIAILLLLSWLLPELPRVVNLVVLVALFALSTAISYRLNKKYEAWREDQLDDEQ